MKACVGKLQEEKKIVKVEQQIKILKNAIKVQMWKRQSKVYGILIAMSENAKYCNFGFS